MFKLRAGMGPVGNEIGSTIWELYFWNFGNLIYVPGKSVRLEFNVTAIAFPPQSLPVVSAVPHPRSIRKESNFGPVGKIFFEKGDEFLAAPENKRWPAPMRCDRYQPVSFPDLATTGTIPRARRD